MFYLSDDKKTIKDFFGDKVGYIVNGKFCQVLKKKLNSFSNECHWCDEPYSEGLSPMELEQVSELLQRANK